MITREVMLITFDHHLHAIHYFVTNYTFPSINAYVNNKLLYEVFNKQSSTFD